MAGQRKRNRSSLNVVEWKKWGEVDPLWGVAAWPGKDRASNGHWTDEEFYELGAADWEDFRIRWERYGMSTATCLEIGCGAGRITKQLEGAFGHLDAVDVSDAMIIYARAHIPSETVTFHVTEGLVIPLRAESVDAVFSSHVFQHLDSLAEAATYFEDIVRVMAPGATVMLHLPVYEWPVMGSWFEAVYKSRRAFATVRARLARPLVARGMRPPIMRGLVFPVDWLFDTFEGIGLQGVELMQFRVRSNKRLHPFIFARKAGCPP